MPVLPVPMPTQDAFVNRDGTLSDVAIKWLTTQSQTTASGPRKLATVDKSAQDASIASTSLYSSAIPAGVYRVSYFALITRAAGASSELTVAFGFTANVTTQSFTGALMNGNALTTYQQDTVIMRVDANAPITYSTTYASVGAPTMQYRLNVVLEQLDA